MIAQNLRASNVESGTNLCPTLPYNDVKVFLTRISPDSFTLRETQLGAANAGT
jgi:hypothetical protein